MKNYEKEKYKDIIKDKERSLQLHIAEMDELRRENNRLRCKIEKIKSFLIEVLNQ